MDNGTQTALTLRRLPQGGFVVCDEHRPDMFASEYFASTSIDEALKFMRDKIKPVGAESIHDLGKIYEGFSPKRIHD